MMWCCLRSTGGVWSELSYRNGREKIVEFQLRSMSVTLLFDFLGYCRGCMQKEGK